MPMPVGAVITADIVNSTVPGTAMGKKLVTQLSAVLKDHVFEFYRGDSFQVYTRDPLAALKLSFRLRAVAKKLSDIYDVRVSIGIGNVAARVRSLRTTNSEAFILSGRMFDQLKDTQRLRIGSADEKANIAFRVIAGFADYMLKRLTSKQAEVVLELLKGQTQTQISEKLKKKQSTINKHAHSAGWPEIEKLLYEYHQVIIQFNLA
ncbi:MAG TPA: hypothetical protein PLL71_10630 [Agriterribacter sp.]|mgnify:CR=1 FL=1|nr:hypothetical protein [Agriterribacter sp.]